VTAWESRIADRLRTIEGLGRWRTIRTLDDGPTTAIVVATGEQVVSFASNDYLGLTHHPAVVLAAREALDRYGTGSGAARLIVGSRPPHDELEAALADWTEREAALLFPTGYQANLGVLGALASAADRPLILSDELNHASIIDGARLARAEVEVYRHADVDDLGARLAAAGDRPAVVVTDSVFSMDGDVAPVEELADVCLAHGALLVVDEAHAVLGPPPPPGDHVVVVGTLSKTLGSLGGFVAAPRPVVDLCRNTARSFIFTTATPPAVAAAAHAALEVLRSPEGDELRDHLRYLVDLVRPGHPSPIVPVLLGDESRAVEVSDRLLAHGLLVPAIRPPTVAPGSCRLRIALSAAHTEEMVQRLVDVCGELGVPLGG
jgi:8-amino-7-oxononanoate synthase